MTSDWANVVREAPPVYDKAGYDLVMEIAAANASQNNRSHSSATGLRARSAIPGTDVAYHIRARYAMLRTESVHSGVRCAVLRQRVQRYPCTRALGDARY